MTANFAAGNRNPSEHSVIEDSAVWFALAALSLILILFENSIWTPPHDFGSFYVATRIYLHYGADRVYDLDLQRLLQQQTYNIPPGNLSLRFLPYNHLPYETLLWLPLDGLSTTRAFWIWRVFNIALLIGTVWLLRDTIRAGRSRTQILLITLGFYPVGYCLLAGQDTCVTFALVALSAWLLDRKRKFLAGAALGVGLFKLQLILPIVGIFFLLRHWRLVCGFLCSAALWLGVSTAMVGPRGMGSLVKMWISGETGGSFVISPRTMPNIRGVASSVLSLGPTAALLTTVLVSALLLLLATWQLRRESSASEVFAVALCFVVLVSFHTNLYDLVLLLFPALVLLERAGSSRIAKVLLFSLVFNPFAYAATLLTFTLPYLSIVVVLLWAALAWVNREAQKKDIGSRNGMAPDFWVV